MNSSNLLPQRACFISLGNVYNSSFPTIFFWMAKWNSDYSCMFDHPILSTFGQVFYDATIHVTRYYHVALLCELSQLLKVSDS